MGPASRASHSFERSIARLPEIFDFVGAYLEDERIRESDRFPIQLAVEELFTNMVKYNATGAGEIRIEIARLDRDVNVSLIDFDTDRFDPRESPEVRTDAPIEERTPGGLGIHLVRRLVDRIDYTWNDRRGTTTVVKRLG